jgi:hypothetical protein
MAFNDFLMCDHLGGCPCPGSWREQPHSVCVYFEIFRAAAAEVQEAETKKAKAK